MLRGPRSSSFWSHETKPEPAIEMLVKSREMTGRPKCCRGIWVGGEGGKTTENKMHWPRLVTESRETIQRAAYQPGILNIAIVSCKITQKKFVSQDLI
jgi:hypothetical protein